MSLVKTLRIIKIYILRILYKVTDTIQGFIYPKNEYSVMKESVHENIYVDDENVGIIYRRNASSSDSDRETIGGHSIPDISRTLGDGHYYTEDTTEDIEESIGAIDVD